MSLMPQNRNPAQAVLRFNEFFKNCTDEMVWCRAVQPPGQQGIIQHSMSIVDGTNYYRIPPITVGDPMCLSTYAPYEALRKSSELRTSVTKGILELLTTDQADAFFAKKASVGGRSIDMLKNEAANREASFLNHEPLVDPNRPAAANERALDSVSEAVTFARTKNNQPIVAEEVVKPYIIHLCQQVSSELKEEACMPANELLMKLQEIEPTLSMDDLEHIRAHGRWKSVKQWATQKQASVAEAFEIDDTKPRPSAPQSDSI